MKTEYSVVGNWTGNFDEAKLRSWAADLRLKLQAPEVTLGLVFMTPAFFDRARPILEILRVHCQIPLLIGCSSTGLIAGSKEFEDTEGIVTALYHLPGAVLHACRFTQEQLEEANGPAYWHHETGLSPDSINGWLAFADPFHLDSEGWIRSWNEAYAPLPILGGLASGNSSEHQTQVYLNGEAYSQGGVALAVGGQIKLSNVISQGCTPIGETWTITQTEGNLIHKIGNRPAYQVLVDTFNALPPEEQQKTRGNLFIGLVVNEYLEEFHRGDFLIRNVLGADPQSGTIAVGAMPRAGQTLQFQRRDAAAASEDLAALLNRARTALHGSTLYGACLCCCNGRGARLFGEEHHDAQLVQKALGPLGLAGFFCNGEIGPVGGRNYLHGYTASLALFHA